MDYETSQHLAMCRGENMQTNAVALHFMQYETKYVLTFIKNTLVNIIYTQERRG
jgi:hypothetical protein